MSQGGAGGGQTMTSFAVDIKPLFRALDVTHMKGGGVLLDDYTYMSQPANAQNVYDHLTGTASPQMPPGNPWPQNQIDLFKKWMDEGLKP
jgi:hypothetical protein